MILNASPVSAYYRVTVRVLKFSLDGVLSPNLGLRCANSMLSMLDEPEHQHGVLAMVHWPGWRHAKAALATLNLQCAQCWLMAFKIHGSNVG